MKIRYIEEPSLLFGTNDHICPKAGIIEYGPFDINGARHEKIMIGIVGKSESISLITEWLEKCKGEISAKQVKKGKKEHLNLFPSFPGFNQNVAFKCGFTYDDTYLRTINNSDIEYIIRHNESLENIITNVAKLYTDEIKYLTQNKHPDIILCVLSEDLFSQLNEENIDSSSDGDDEPVEDNSSHYQEPREEDDDELNNLERNFRRHLKAKAMQFSVPIQIIRDRLASPTSEMQDTATIAWNLFTAIYYKAGGTPWALIRKDMSETTCYAGISFYRSRDKKSIQTSIAQIFNEHGKGIILRGEEIIQSKDDRTPHLKAEQAYKLLDLSLKEYLTAIKQTPKRLVLHKTSNFNDEEIDGFRQAAKKYHIDQIDMITIFEFSDIRLYRERSYPPLRGTHVSLTEKNHILYTRGSVPYYETYTGMYIPRPLEIRLFDYDESPNLICDEILALTKMNWNNTQFDRKLPITLECARNVGDILKYLEAEDKMQLRYSFYM
jgi:hypothetical protein